MLRYEVLILANPNIGSDDELKLQEYFKSLVSGAKGEFISFDKWGKYYLSFPVKKQEYGVYFLIRFTLPHDVVVGTLKDIESFFKIKFNDVVMRYVTRRLKEGVSLEYQKPDPIGTVRTPSFDDSRAADSDDDLEMEN
ncbi:TPA: hypothetical protein DEO28_00760 [Candidatus Dependentiae bacterium]|nr:MAG: 30S ribosomal protein S6 [candidate division TM6 bacterium GW2011_GWE2_31_21]KKP54124.1 MAG: 30S ribosomal protein S6 [candidate division TM6 bacterium GW2011_GWF2_33_332]HBS47845.1 hypothetical protein [Candidatus Dependentiae bacterium]HBZ73030.1 hypothetical protein [Candidatus Dependentiae bacterium]